MWFATMGRACSDSKLGSSRCSTRRTGSRRTLSRHCTRVRKGLWVGSQLGALDRSGTARFAAPTSNVSMVDCPIMEEDGGGRLWLSSAGCSRFPRHSCSTAATGSDVGGLSSHDLLDGLRGNRVQLGRRNSGWAGGDGTLWYPRRRDSSRGSEARETNPIAPQVHIERLVVDGHERASWGRHRNPQRRGDGRDSLFARSPDPDARGVRYMLEATRARGSRRAIVALLLHGRATGDTRSR